MYCMIRARPWEWRHLEIKGSGDLGGRKVAGTLHITTRRCVLQTSGGPVWEANHTDTEVSQGKNGLGILRANNSILNWKSKVPVSWWGNSILFWKAGTLVRKLEPHGYPPRLGDPRELASTLRGTSWAFREYDAKELKKCGIEGDIPETDSFRKTCANTNMILAALSYDGHAQGPPPAAHLHMVRRHALTNVSALVWAWKNARLYVRDIIRGKGYLGRACVRFLEHASWPDRYFEEKPYGAEPEWHHRMNPASLGGMPYTLLERIDTMIPVLERVAADLHREPTDNPYRRLRELFEAREAGEAPPDPSRGALEAARVAAGRPW